MLEALILALFGIPTEPVVYADEIRKDKARIIAVSARTRDYVKYAQFKIDDDKQFKCFDKLMERESNWRTKENPQYADNPNSSAYGIPQALPGHKMASAGHDWEHNPITQIRWALGYIKDRYGSPCDAWEHSQKRGWY